MEMMRLANKKANPEKKRIKRISPKKGSTVTNEKHSLKVTKT